MLKKLKARLQSLKAEREEAKHKEEMALRGKDAVRCQAFVPGCGRSLLQGSCKNTELLALFPQQAEAVLEAFCAHASQRISQLEQDLASTGNFRGLLKETQAQLVI